MHNRSVRAGEAHDGNAVVDRAEGVGLLGDGVRELGQRRLQRGKASCRSGEGVKSAIGRAGGTVIGRDRLHLIVDYLAILPTGLSAVLVGGNLIHVTVDVAVAELRIANVAVIHRIVDKHTGVDVYCAP